MNADPAGSIRKRTLVLLLIAGLVLQFGVVLLVQTPGYMDAEYYFAGGQQLYWGNGFWEPFLWNYLDDPAGLPHISHTYWMPLPSLIAAGGMFLQGNDGFNAARSLFIPLAALVPVVTALIAWRLGLNTRQGALAGVLALFSGFYLPYAALPESFALYMLLGGGFFLTAFPVSGSLAQQPLHAAALGLIAGLMHLSRADGLLWGLGAAAVIVLDALASQSAGRWKKVLAGVLLAGAGYALVMGAWYGRNLSFYGQLMPPGGSKTIYLTDYNQTFVYPADSLTLETWLQTSWREHLSDRLQALQSNLMTLLGVQSLVVLLPLMSLGGWRLRKQRMVWVGLLAWLATLLVMTLAFPYSGARGGFFHSGSALQPLLWALAPAGLEELIARGARKRGWKPGQAVTVFGIGLAVLCALISGMLFSARVWGASGEDWNLTWRVHQQVGRQLAAYGAQETDIVMVNNPPGFHAATGFPAVVIPDGDVDTLTEVAERFDVQYLVLDRNVVSELKDLYANPRDFPGFHYLGTFAESRYFLSTGWGGDE